MQNLVKAYDIPQDKAKEKWQEYCEYLRSEKGKDADETITQLKDVYYQLSKGRQVIDIYESFKIAGKNEFDQPRLAIIRADQKEVVFERRAVGAGAFWSVEAWRNRFGRYPQVSLPQGTLSDWRLTQSLRCPVPIIPAEYIPNGKLDRYFILWEVMKWEPLPPVDPFLLRRLTSNLFVVLAVWDLTELERAVMRGAIG